MSASRYRLCWCSCLALVLLRVAIGTHFLHEGLSKIDSWREGTKPFSAEGYLANSSGPLRDWFRSQLDDPDGLKRLVPASLVNRWDATLRELQKKYNLTERQQTSARAKIRQLELAKEEHFSNPDNKRKISGYLDAMEKVAKDAESGLAFERERAKDKRKELAKTRDELLGPMNAWDKALREHVAAELDPEQIAKDSQERLGGLAGMLRLPFSLSWPDRPIDRINLMTMCGLTLAGGFLIIGLFSRLSALWAAAFLAMIYLANPAPPLGAGNPSDPGHYMVVNKELVECLAALVLATIPTGRWLGLDALVRGLLTRRLSAACFGTPDDAIVKA